MKKEKPRNSPSILDKKIRVIINLDKDVMKLIFEILLSYKCNCLLKESDEFTIQNDKDASDQDKIVVETYEHEIGVIWSEFLKVLVDLSPIFLKKHQGKVALDWCVRY